MSFSIANTGLSAVTEQLNTISNNIANSATKGFKSGRTEFASMYAQSQPLGVAISGVSQSISKEGSLDKTGIATDLAIAGSGFFVVKDSSGDTAYTRAGMFSTDNNGNLLSSSGMKLQGYPADAAGNLQTGVITDLQINNAGLAAKATGKIALAANLQASATAPTATAFDPTDKKSYNFHTESMIYDSLGNRHSLIHYFTKQSTPGEWKVQYTLDGATTALTVTNDLKFDTSGKLTGATPFNSLSGPFSQSAGVATYSIDIDYTGTTQFNGESIANKNTADGYTAGIKNGERIEGDGSVYATFSNGERMLQGKLVLANFANPNGLATKNGTTWSETGKSGAALLGAPGSGLLGNIETGALEASNVDLTAELVGLMTAQRNYQANTKIISTNDSMMNALFQVL
ncbi:flagellar hook protein FlgE [Yersinia enterocolitica]|uniref:flagellar hook protein FlgE n=1 Tax=Yersinia enterocolitica TaxID=630 RepID=UPI002876BAFB|nr:flagellar basal body protein FlgE [Yersinia enterocolitica]EKN5982958.1 flagellar basal body protein FlaE [Yersinia enterocolitica]EKN5988015.1 flagellar basal body protein FlaE [Yersinia enterocolitica]ELX2240723.1 flagellar basal body protein FlgE [Yersinia enterocolitica]HDL6716100.1 flagellar basal body protein FlgE [Yersinia enterocolitica]